MNKKYQVFVSSTYEDLKEERLAVMDSLLRSDCIPVGMERFNSIQMTQMEYIKKLIDQSDYYVLISAGRYGAIDESTGKSYTEEEFDYAISKGVPVVVMLYEHIEQLPYIKVEQTDDSRKQLEIFREKLKKDRLVNFYTTKDELSLKVVNSLRETIENFPRPGWVRGDAISEEDDLVEEMEEPKIKKVSMKPFITLPMNNGRSFATLGLDAAAQVLLEYMTSEKDGTLIVSKTLSGTTISTSGNKISSDGARREIALWENAVKQLQTARYIEKIDGSQTDDIYTVTNEGFNVSDEIASKFQIDLSSSPMENVKSLEVILK